MTRQQYKAIFKGCSFYNTFIEIFADKKAQCVDFNGFDDYTERYDPIDWVVSAFTWNTTPQGKNHWEYISNRWRRFVDGNGVRFELIAEWYKEVKPVTTYTKRDWIKIFKACSFYQDVVKYYNPEFSDTPKDFEEFLENYCVENFISEAFDFEDTDEGFDYWYEISEQWRECVFDHNIKAIEAYYTSAETKGKAFSVKIPKNKAIMLNFQI